MRVRSHHWLFLCLMLITVVSTLVSAQQDEVTVPDVTGLTVPQAAAELNRVGLVLGNRTNMQWTDSMGVPVNTIGMQSIAAGTSTDYGSTVDVTLLREPNVLLIYDGNDLTMVNQAGSRINLGDLSFRTLQSNTQAGFNARRWSANLRPNQCTQIWSITRNGPKGLPECDFIQNWLATNNRSDHFWTAANGVSTFNVLLDGEELAICDAAPANSENEPLTCEFYIPAGGAGDTLPFVQFTYTDTQLVIFNPTADSWMRTNQTTIHNANPNGGPLAGNFRLGAPRTFNNIETVGDIRLLAPGQCLIFVSTEAGGDTPLEDCDIVATLELQPNQLFWSFNFEVEDQEGTRRTCTAADPQRLTICMLPR
jgi:hypothetical protein